MQKFLDKDAKLVVVGSCNNLDSYKQKYMHDKIKFLGAIYDDKLINLSCCICLCFSIYR